MYLALIVLPLLGSIVSGFFGRKIGVQGSHIITCSCVITTTLLAIVVFLEVGMNNVPVSLELFRWIDSESLNVLWGFNFDSLTVAMLIPVLIVSSLVHIYSIGYMSHDPHNQRFFSYLSLFTFMMIILVTANNFLLMFVGWEGVGICSYLLVSFWFTRIAANQSSLAAFLTNRVGDCLLTIGMFAILWTFGNIDYTTVFSLAPYINENIITIIGICLLIGAMAKSSQVGLHIWLPMAMEGPTPVSALIHAATMVTAGVYLLIRSSPLIEYSSTTLILCLWIGAITTLFSSLIGLFQQDIKKVIAYSTMSQLGMMVIAVGLSSYNIALFHLVNHAFYKALLFLGAGSVIHAVADNQDFRKYGGLKQFLPLTYSVILIASLSLVAFPFMTGFYSKDLILESAYGQYYLSGIAVYYIAVIGAMFTTLYSIKVLYLTFIANPNGPLNNYKQAHEGDIFMSLPLIILAVFSIFFGYTCKDIFIGLGSHFFVDNSIFIHPDNEILLNTEFAVPLLFKMIPLLLTISLSIISILIPEYIPKFIIAIKNSRIGYNIFSLLNQRFYIELLYNYYINSKVLMLGGQTTKVLDKGSIELVGPYGLEKGLLSLSKNLNKLDTGILTSYALYILIGLIFYLITPYIALHDYSLLILLIFGLFTLNKADTKSIVNINKFTSKQSNLIYIIDYIMAYLFHNNSIIKHFEYNIALLSNKFMRLSIFEMFSLFVIIWYLYIIIICGYILNNVDYKDDIHLIYMVNDSNQNTIDIYFYLKLITYKYWVILYVYWKNTSTIKILLSSYIMVTTLFIALLNSISTNETKTNKHCLLSKFIGLVLFIYNKPRYFIYILISNIIVILFIRNIYGSIFTINFKEYIDIFTIIHLILNTQLIVSISFSYISNTILHKYKIIDNKKLYNISTINITNVLLYILLLFIAINIISPMLKSIIIMLIPYITYFFENIYEYVKNSFNSNHDYNNQGWPKKPNPKGPHYKDINYKYDDDDDMFDYDFILDQFIYSYYNISRDYFYTFRNECLVSFPRDINGSPCINDHPYLKIEPTVFTIKGKSYNNTEMKSLLDYYNKNYYEKAKVEAEAEANKAITINKPWEYRIEKQLIKDLSPYNTDGLDPEARTAKYKFFGDEKWIDSVIYDIKIKENQNIPYYYIKENIHKLYSNLWNFSIEYFVVSNARKYHYAIANGKEIDPIWLGCFNTWRIRQQGWIANLFNENSLEESYKWWNGSLIDFSNDQDIIEILKSDFEDVSYGLVNEFVKYSAICNAGLAIEDIDNLYSMIIFDKSKKFFYDTFLKKREAYKAAAFSRIDVYSERWIRNDYRVCKFNMEDTTKKYFSDYQVSKYVRKTSIFDCLKQMYPLRYRVNNVGFSTAYNFGYNGKKISS